MTKKEIDAIAVAFACGWHTACNAMLEQASVRPDVSIAEIVHELKTAADAVVRPLPSDLGAHMSKASKSYRQMLAKDYGEVM